MLYLVLDRPLCITEGCYRPGQQLGRKKSGGHYYRSTCAKCYGKIIGKRYGVKNMMSVIAKKAGFNSISEYNLNRANESGFESFLDYLDHKARLAGFENHRERVNARHPYRKFRKDYCENIDGRLGFTCTTTVSMKAILQVDHINSNSSDNREENLQTLCACCHIHKTITNKDWKTLGRKGLRKLLQLLS